MFTGTRCTYRFIPGTSTYQPFPKCKDLLYINIQPNLSLNFVAEWYTVPYHYAMTRQTFASSAQPTPPPPIRHPTAHLLLFTTSCLHFTAEFLKTCKCTMGYLYAIRAELFISMQDRGCYCSSPISFRRRWGLPGGYISG